MQLKSCIWKGIWKYRRWRYTKQSRTAWWERKWGWTKCTMVKVSKQDTSIYKKQVTRKQMSKLRLGVYFPTDFYAYFLVTNYPFKKERIYPGYFFPKQRRQLMESWRTERITYGRGKKNKTGGGNVINECKESLTRKSTSCQIIYWTTMNMNKNQIHSSKCKYNRDAHRCSPAVVL